MASVQGTKDGALNVLPRNHGTGSFQEYMRGDMFNQFVASGVEGELLVETRQVWLKGNTGRICKLKMPEIIALDIFSQWRTRQKILTNHTLVINPAFPYFTSLLRKIKLKENV